MNIELNTSIKQQNTQYFQNPNLYPNLDSPLQVVTETDAELFNNLFDDNQIHRQNMFKKFAGCIFILCLYISTGYMYYKYIYLN